MGEATAIAKKETEATAAAFNGMAAVGKAAFLGIGAAVVVGGGAALKMAGDFESATNRLVTSAGESRENIDMLRKGMLQMAGEVGFSAMELAKAMYTVDSAGFTAAKGGLTVLRAAAQGAKAEGADLKVVADAVTTALIDYHKGAKDAAQTTTTLIAAVSQGKTSFAELTGSLHSVLPIASAAGISLADITAAVASMTVHGMSADQATQNLAHTIQHLQTVTAPQAKELALLGINARELSADLGTKGLTGTLIMIDEAIRARMGADGQVILQMQQALAGLPPEVQKLGTAVINGTATLGEFSKASKGLSVEQAGLVHQFATLMTSSHGLGQNQKTGTEIMQAYAAALKAATGDSTTLNTALMLTGENTKYTRDAVKAVAGATVEAGNNVAGWAEIQKTFNQHLDRARDGLGAWAITVGTQLIPYAIQAIDTTARLTDWFSKHHAAAMALAVAIGVPLTAAMTAYVIQLGISVVSTTAATASTLAHATATVFLAAVTQGQALVAFIQLAVQYGILNALSVTTIGMWAAQTAATIAHTAATVAVTVATGAWTAMQWLLNFALSANPIGLVIVAIGALVAGFIWAYQNVGWFRDAVNWAWGVLQQFGGWISGTLGPTLRSLGEWIGNAAGALGGLLEKASKLPGVSGAIQAVARDSSLPGRAAGGPVSPGAAYLVGEKGPEMLVMGPSGGQVYPNVSAAGGGAQVDMDDTNTLLAQQNMLLSQILAALRPGTPFSTRAYSPTT